MTHQRFPSCYNRSPLRIGLLGGSFNPPHAGHLYISLQALKNLRLDAVWWLVTPQNPLKSARGLAPLKERLRLARKLVKHPALRVTALEEQLGTTYTCDTLTQLQKRYPTYRFVWLMGADNLIELPRWHRFQDILKKVAVAVYARGNMRYKALAGKVAVTYKKHRLAGCKLPQLASAETPVWGFVSVRIHPLSSTLLRQQHLTDRSTLL